LEDRALQISKGRKEKGKSKNNWRKPTEHFEIGKRR